MVFYRIRARNAGRKFIRWNRPGGVGNPACKFNQRWMCGWMAQNFNFLPILSGMRRITVMIQRQRPGT